MNTASLVVNDVHSQLNPTRVRRIVRPQSVDALRAAIRQARADGLAVSVCGRRHAMGGQQFGADTVLVDTTGLGRLLRLDAERGLVEVEAGIQWPALVAGLIDLQRGRDHQRGIVQK